METSQSKLLQIVLNTIYFLLITALGVVMIHEVSKIQEQKAKNDLRRSNVIITQNIADDGLIEDAADDVYLGENNSPAFKTITGNGDVVTKAAVYMDLINLPDDISKVIIDGTVYSNGDPKKATINGYTNISYLIKEGKEKSIYRNTLQNKGETFLRTYIVDSQENITGVEYKTK